MSSASNAMFHVYCGAETGLLKGVNTAKKTFVNLNKTADLNREHEITALKWADPEESQIYCALRKQVVTTHDAQTGLRLNAVNVRAGEGPIKGLEIVNKALVTCSQSGAFRVWNPCQNGDEEVSPRLELDVGPDVFRMRQNPMAVRQFATGGKENDLKLWDLNNPEKPIFMAKNVRNDHLDLRVPIWVTDFRFWDDSRIVVGTGYHKLRIYDTKCGQRRPVAEMDFEEFPITCLSLAGDRAPTSVLVGNTHGRVALYDIRKQRLVHAFKGFAGSVRAVEVHPAKPYVVSCSLDRILRVHDFQHHSLLSRVYLKSRLSSLLLRTIGGEKSIRLSNEVNEEEAALRDEAADNKDHSAGQQNEAEQPDDGHDSDDQLWEKMGVMKEEAESGIESADEALHSEVSAKRNRCSKRKSQRVAGASRSKMSCAKQS